MLIEQEIESLLFCHNVVNWTTIIEYLFNLNHYLDWHVSWAKLCSVKN